LQQAGFQSVAAYARPACFDLWAIAYKNKLDEFTLIQQAQIFFPFK
jgi:hypothetical protein